jgi:short-subunit dehydrogenase
VKSDTGTTIRRRTPKEQARLRTGLILAGASGLLFVGLRRALTTLPVFDRSVVLITGGSRGLGLALAEEFRRQGAHLALLARDEDELNAARMQLIRRLPASREILLLTGDVSEPPSVQQAVESCLQHFGRIDVLVNNAGVIHVGAIESQTHSDFKQAMDVNFWGVVNTTLAVLPHMLDRRAGRIVNITSIGGIVSMPHLLPYNASKFAAMGFSLGLRAELTGKGVAVTTIVPGLMRTGSYMNATFKGKAADEYSWFSVSSSLPGISISAARAAHQIVEAAWRKKGEVILGMSAKVGSRLYSLFPGLGADVLGLLNRVLPAAGSKKGKLGRESRTPVSESVVTKLGQAAAERYNQQKKMG